MNPTKTHNTSLGKNGTDRFGFIGDGSEATSFNGARNEEYYEGEIDEIRLWNYARSSGEIQEYRDEKFQGCEYGLDLYFDFDGVSGSSIPDLTGNGYDATAGGTYDYVGGAPVYLDDCPQEYYLDFSTNNSCIAIDHSYTEQGEIDELTVEAWINTGEYNPGGNPGTWDDNWAILDFDRNEYFSLCVDQVTGTVGFSTTGAGSSTPHDMKGNIFVADGEWHHIAAVFDGINKEIYVDGELDRIITNPHNNTSLGKNGTDRYGFIGDGSESSTFNGSHNNYYYTGSVDEIRLWNYARSSAEIQENRGKRLTGCNAGLVLYYDFNEGGGTGFYGKATHTFARFNGAISRETAGAPLPNCASPSFESDPLLVGLSDYRYGFNGKEMDNEVSGNGNQYDYGFRIYNPRLGRFLSTDPIITDKKMYPWYSPYHFAGNSPILNIDIEGLEDANAIKILLVNQIEIEISKIDEEMIKNSENFMVIDRQIKDLKNMREVAKKIHSVTHGGSEGGGPASEIVLELGKAILDVPQLEDLDADIKMYSNYKSTLEDIRNDLKQKKNNLKEEKSILDESIPINGSEDKEGELIYPNNQEKALTNNAINTLSKRVEKADNGNTKLKVEKPNSKD